MSTLPADVLSLPDRGRLKVGAYASVVVFDPVAIQDHATYAKPHQRTAGVQHVPANGQFAISDGKATGAPTGHFIRGRAAISLGGSCKDAASQWPWKWTR